MQKLLSNKFFINRGNYESLQQQQQQQQQNT